MDGVGIVAFCFLKAKGVKTRVPPVLQRVPPVLRPVVGAEQCDVRQRPLSDGSVVVVMV